ncbi:MAG: signal peptidase I [Candidatus Acidiferrales bacterium]
MQPETEERARIGLVCELLRQFGALRFRAQGSSMIPSIYPGDILSVRQAAIHEVRCGDVVLYLREAGLCAHRVVRVQANGGQYSLVTRGDALLQDDSPVHKEELLGRVVSVARGVQQARLRGGRPQKRLLVMRWCVRRSNGLAKALLHLNALRLQGRGKLPGRIFSRLLLGIAS